MEDNTDPARLVRVKIKDLGQASILRAGCWNPDRKNGKKRRLFVVLSG